jgi:lipopolysaccharide transport system permease protein
MHYQSSVRAPLWQAAWALLRDHSGLIRAMVRRELSNRYKGSVMGWPGHHHTGGHDRHLYANLLRHIQCAFRSEGGHVGFAVYLFCGLLPWIAFSEGIQRATSVLNENVNFVKRVVFPIEALL